MSQKRRSTPTPSREQLLHLGSLITYHDPDVAGERCLGYLGIFEGHGVFEPSFGRVDVTSEEAELHNRALSQAEIQGLDQHCAVGQGSYFFVTTQDGRMSVATFVGEVLASNVVRSGNRYRFSRAGKSFEGRRLKDEDGAFFKRVA